MVINGAYHSKRDPIREVGSCLYPQPRDAAQKKSRHDVPKAGGKWLFLIEATHRDCTMHLPNPIHPDRLSAAERRGEACRLLATGLLRLRQRESDDRDRDDRSRAVPESSLPLSADRSGHATRRNRRTA